ncbi:hypothetical protein L0F63_003734 [Massospora cicadina]|nr:hypothetical protein L0F63_003734 [Massospora cicadina]
MKPSNNKKETEEAARVYAEFLASFEDEPSNSAPHQGASTASAFTTKPFVRGKSFVPSSVFVKEPSEPEIEALTKNPAVSQTTVTEKNYSPQSLNSSTNPALEAKPTTPQLSSFNTAKKPRVLDELMVELKRQQEERDERLKNKQIKLPGGSVALPDDSASLTLKAAFEDLPGSIDVDPTSTNLYLGNISVDADENALCQAFGKFGPIASVKIMWPRTLEEKERQRNCGFVSFMDRASALAAIKEMDGFELNGHAIRVSWGKPVPIPPKPFFDMNAKAVLIRSGLPFNARTSISSTNQQKPGVYKFVPPPGKKPTPQPTSEVRLEVHVRLPKDPSVLALIHRVIERVCVYGYAFEGLLMQREARNEKFQFLFDFDTPEHVYYRWKLYSLLQGDTVDVWRTEPFRMFDDGPFFIPPAMATPNQDSNQDPSGKRACSIPYPSAPQDTEHGAAHKGKLSAKQRKAFQAILEELTVDRKSVGFAMVAALERVGESEDIADLIQEHICKEGLPPMSALAALYLISDILHNITPMVSQAWRLRAELEKRLDAIFMQVHKIYCGIAGRLRAETFRRFVAAIFPVWEASLLFPAPFLHQLQNLFQYGSTEPPNDAGSSSLQSQPNPLEDDDVDGAPCAAPDDYNDVDGTPLEDNYDDIDGVPLPSNAGASDDDMFA